MNQVNPPHPGERFGAAQFGQGAPSSSAAPQRRGSDAGSPAVYYLNPLQAGPLEGWANHFARAAGMGFDAVLLAPPFAPGRTGNIFLTADHWRLHPALGGGDARDALRQAASSARAVGLRLMLDIVADRVAADGPLAQDNASWFAAQGPDALLDPRLGPDAAAIAAWRLDAGPDAALGWWAGRIQEWLDCGISGFRAVEAWRLPGHWWHRLIRGLPHGAASFIADTTGGAPAQVAELAGAGFDFSVSSSAWWDYRAGWLTEDATRAVAVAPPLALAEPLFGPRLTAGVPDAALAARLARRALGFAAAYATGWIMPMGFEIGARASLDPAGTAPLETSFDLSEDVAAVNAARAALPALHGDVARLLSAPDAPVAALLRADLADRARATLILANPSADRPAELAVASLLPELGHAYAGLMDNAGSAETLLAPDAVVSLQPAGLRVLRAVAAPPVLRSVPAGLAGARTGADSPRIAIEAVSPTVDAGRFPAKRITGELVEVSADIICDGHDKLAVRIAWRAVDEDAWHETPMESLGNDRWAGSFPLARLGRHEFAVLAWKDEYATFRDELQKKHAAGVPVTLELEEGRLMLDAAGARDPALKHLAARLKSAEQAERLEALQAADTVARMQAADPRPYLNRSDAMPVDAERSAARFAAWYELFPRSQTHDPARHGTFLDVIDRLPAIRDMGFDVLYFPPIHPIGMKNRKGRNNTLTPTPDDPGSPYAIGSADGGHDALHPELGTIEDFRRMRDAAAAHGLELALDFAIQCSPDHPWLKQHPDWFDWRPDGTIRYAENPPKKYEDIVNVDFYAPSGERGPGAVPALWVALRDAVLIWAEEGVRTFRVDNPHTKPLPFWEWMIGDIRARYPDTLFLAEAFTKPKMMYRLAKVGFSQSYTYFTWRNTKAELAEYLTELTTTAPKDFFRPNFFVNTPDINPPFLQTGGRPAHLLRAALATTLAGLWGMYNGFEICEATPVPGKEEYLDSEKYQIRVWDWNRPGNIIPEITRLNRIRRANPALHSHLGVEFQTAHNDNILLFTKATPDRSNVLLVAVSMDPLNAQEADIEIPLWDWKLPDDGRLVVRDLMRDTDFTWHGKYQRIRLDPRDLPFAVWRLTPA